MYPEDTGGGGKSWQLASKQLASGIEFGGKSDFYINTYLILVWQSINNFCLIFTCTS